MFARLLIGTVLCTLIAAPAIGQNPVVRESPGTPVIDNPARARAPVMFKLGDTPKLDLGGLEDNPENEFAANQGYLRGARMSDGSFAAIDVSRVQFFDPRGKRMTIAGREGAGPEEFRYLMSICRTRGDTIVVDDSRNGRLGILDSKGHIVRTVRRAELGSTPFNACFDDGTLVLQKSISTTPGGARTMHLTRVRLDGTVVNEIGDFTFPPFDMVTQSEGTVLAWKQRLYVADGLTSEVRIYTPAGKLVSVIRSADPLVKITDAEAEDRMRSTIPRNTSAAEVADRMDRMRSLATAKTWPAFRRMHVDPRGTLWIQDYTTKYPSPDGWTAFDINGRMIGRLVIPAPKDRQDRMEIISFGLDELLVRRQDADGAAHLTFYPILPIGR